MSDVLDTAQRIELFLKDDAVQAAISAMKEQNYKLFLGATTAEARAMAQAQAIVLEGFETMLRATVSAGERERLEQEQRERAPATR